MAKAAKSEVRFFLYWETRKRKKLKQNGATGFESVVDSAGIPRAFPIDIPSCSLA